MKSCPILQKLGGYVKHYNHDTWWKDEGDPLRTVAVRAISNFLPLLSGFFKNWAKSGKNEKLSNLAETKWVCQAR